LRCEVCGTETRAKLAKEVAASGYGPRVVATVALLGGIYRASQRLTQRAMAELYGVEISLGTVNALRQEASEALAEPVEKAHDYVKQQEMVSADETGYKQGDADGANPQGKKAWLWVAVTALVTVFKVSLSRGQEAACLKGWQAWGSRSSGSRARSPPGRERRYPQAAPRGRAAAGRGGCGYPVHQLRYPGCSHDAKGPRARGARGEDGGVGALARAERRPPQWGLETSSGTYSAPLRMAPNGHGTPL
jgi:hypothetical protein